MMILQTKRKLMQCFYLEKQILVFMRTDGLKDTKKPFQVSPYPVKSVLILNSVVHATSPCNRLACLNETLLKSYIVENRRHQQILIWV